ncbi:hypothetical protein Goshw_024323, partial [Gossypium schwendimanii]|nr:hypothetical protein [Gossypium schwendimanii]
MATEVWQQQWCKKREGAAQGCKIIRVRAAATTEREWEDKVTNLKKKDEKTAKELMSNLLNIGRRPFLDVN